MELDLRALADHYEAIALDCDALAAEAESFQVSMRKQAVTARTRAAALRAHIDGPGGADA